MILPAFFLLGTSLTGTADVVDGDTLRIDDTRIRLVAMDAPEMGQLCRFGGSGRDCGERAKSALTALIGEGEVVCLSEGEDVYGRTLATCSVGDRDLGRAMVRAGWAVSYPETGGRYRIDELGARFFRRGMWASRFNRPHLYRRQQREERARPGS